MSQIDTILTLIAQKHLGIETLQTRSADSLDFHETAVWCLKDALEAAFKAGVELGKTYPRPIVDHGTARDAALAALKGHGPPPCRAVPLLILTCLTCTSHTRPLPSG